MEPFLTEEIVNIVMNKGTDFIENICLCVVICKHSTIIQVIWTAEFLEILIKLCWLMAAGSCEVLSCLIC